MRIGLFASNASLAEYFVLADHAVTLYSARQGLFSALAASLQGGAPREVLLLKLIVDASGRQTLTGLSGLEREPGLCIIALGTAGRDAITLTQPALPALYLRQLPLPLGTLLALIQAQRTSESSAALSSFGSKADSAIYS